MKFTRQIKINTLAEGKTHNGEIFDIEKVSKGDYYDVQVKTKDGMISIWVSDTVTPDHPLFDVFDAYIDVHAPAGGDEGIADSGDGFLRREGNNRYTNSVHREEHSNS